MYLDFSEMQPIFETCLKDNGNLSRIQIFEIISSYGLIVFSLLFNLNLQTTLFCITSTRTLILRRGDIEAIAQGEGDATGIVVFRLMEHHAIAIERKAVDATIEEVVS